jgi:hypothetical protein
MLNTLIISRICLLQLRVNELRQIEDSREENAEEKIIEQ